MVSVLGRLTTIFCADCAQALFNLSGFSLVVNMLETGDGHAIADDTSTVCRVNKCFSNGSWEL